MKKKLQICLFAPLLLIAVNNLQAKDKMGLKQVLRQALDNHPFIIAGEYSLQASEMLIKQAEKINNPTLSIEREDFGLSSPEQAKTKIALSYPINWKQRQTQVEIADADKNLTFIELQNNKALLIKEISHLFVTVLGKQEQQEIAHDEVNIAKSVLEIVRGRAQAGRISPVEETKAALTLNQAVVQEQDNIIAFNQAVEKLKYLLGMNHGKPLELQDDLSFTATLPELNIFLQKIPDTQTYKSWTMKLKKQDSIIQHAQAKQWPEISISAGLIQFETGGEKALSVAMDIELPIFDRNAAQIDAEKANLLALKTKQANVKLQVQQQVIQAYFNWQAALNRLNMLKNQIIPQAKEIFDAAQDSYSLGKLSYLDVLDAERSLVAARKQYINSYVAYHHARIKMDYLSYGADEE